jgi:pyrroloquinoline quinone biosynthesis protein B
MARPLPISANEMIYMVELLENGSIEEWIDEVDFALLDGTFFDESEIFGRNIREIPHPLICESILESIKRFAKYENRDRIFFTHLNHTNRCLQGDSRENSVVEKSGMHILHQNQEFTL